MYKTIPVDTADNIQALMHVCQSQQKCDRFKEKEEQRKDKRQRVQWRKGSEHKRVSNKQHGCD
jgi:hypothetical protein